MSRSESFIVTQTGDAWNLVETDVLNQYSVKSESKQIDEEDLFKGIDDVLSPLYDPSELNKLLELNVWHERCVDAIASDIAGQGWTLKPKSNIENPSEQEKKLIEEFLQSLRPSINDLIYKKRYDERANGNGAWEIIRTNGRDSPLYNVKHVPSHTLRRLKDGVRVVQKVGTKKVYFVIMGKNKKRIAGKDIYYDVNSKTGEISYKKLPESERANEIIISKIYTPRSKFNGNPKIIPGIRTIYGDIHRANYNASFFKNFGMPAFALIVTGDFEPDPNPGEDDYDEKKTLKYNIKQQLKQVIKNPHSAITVMVPTREGDESRVEVQLQPLSIETKEASFRLYRKDNRDEIIAAHGVDPNRLGITESGKLNGGNSKELDSAYKTSLIKPGQRREEDDINYYVLNLGLAVNDWEFILIDNDPRNIERDVELSTKLVETGFMTPNEGREFIGETFGISKIEDPRLDEFYYHGQPLGGSPPPMGADSVYSELENSLLDLEDDTDDELVSKKSGIEDSPIIRSLKRLRKERKIP